MILGIVSGIAEGVHCALWSEAQRPVRRNVQVSQQCVSKSAEPSARSVGGRGVWELAVLYAAGFRSEASKAGCSLTGAPSREFTVLTKIISGFPERTGRRDGRSC